MMNTTPTPKPTQTLKVLAMVLGFFTVLACMLLLAFEAQLGFGESTRNAFLAMLGTGVVVGGGGAYKYNSKG